MSTHKCQWCGRKTTAKTYCQACQDAGFVPRTIPEGSQYPKDPKVTSAAKVAEKHFSEPKRPKREPRDYWEEEAKKDEEWKAALRRLNMNAKPIKAKRRSRCQQ